MQTKSIPARSFYPLELHTLASEQQNRGCRDLKTLSDPHNEERLLYNASNTTKLVHQLVDHMCTFYYKIQRKFSELARIAHASFINRFLFSIHIRIQYFMAQMFTLTFRKILTLAVLLFHPFILLEHCNYQKYLLVIMK